MPVQRTATEIVPVKNEHGDRVVERQRRFAMKSLSVTATITALGAGNSAKLPTAPGTNSAGTAQSSGSGAASGATANRREGVTTGSAPSGVDAPGPQTSGDAAINEENKTIDRKLKGICRGC
jgi:hypothetical protein